MKNLKRIIEQEVNKQVWGLELPKKVKLGDKILNLTDKGIYKGKNTKVEYKVDGNKIFTTDGKELIPIHESDFDWVSDSDGNEFDSFLDLELGDWLDSYTIGELKPYIAELGMDTVKDFVDTLRDILDSTHDSGREDGYDSGHSDGHDEGWQNGHEEGWQDGYDTGVMDANNEHDCSDECEEKWQDGYDTGHNDGHSEGHSQGYEEAQDECEECD